MVAEFFFQNLNDLMLENHIDGLNELARLSGVPQSTMSNWKKSKNIPGPENLEKLSAFFRIAPHYFFMKPGTQEEIKPTKRHDDFQVLLDDIANRVLKGQDIITYKQSGASEFVRILRTNYETEHLLPVSWFLEINKELNKYTSVDLIEKIKSIYAERDAKKGQSS